MAKVNEYYPTKLSDYAEKFSEWMKFRLEDHILEMRLHTDDGPLMWSTAAQSAIERVCYEINHDPEVECLIITGTDDYFMKGNLDSSNDPRAERALWVNDYRTPWSTHDAWFHNQTLEPLSIVNLQMPVVSAINGPQHQHPEITMTADVCICSENTYFSEWHFPVCQVPPGDDTWPVWRTLIGHNRARAMMYMGGDISAQDALEWGLVYEVVPLEKLNDRAWEIARHIMSKPRYARRMTRALLSNYWRETFSKELAPGMAYESYATVCDADVWDDDQVKQDTGTVNDQWSYTNK